MVPRWEERGFLLLETVLAGISLMLLILALQFYPQAVRYDVAESCRARAVFLARGQMEALRARGEEGEIGPGEVPWLGREEDLQEAAGEAGPEGFCRFALLTEIGPQDPEEAFYPVKITVRWDGGAAEGEMSFWGRVEHAKNMEQRT